MLQSDFIGLSRGPCQAALVQPDRYKSTVDIHAKMAILFGTAGLGCGVARWDVDAVESVCLQPICLALAASHHVGFWRPFGGVDRTLQAFSRGSVPPRRTGIPSERWSDQLIERLEAK